MILEQIIRKVSEEQTKRLGTLDSGLIREQGLNLQSIQSHALIISGVRRCGKSTLLMQQMKNFGNTFYLNFETPLLFGFEMNDFERLDRIILHNKAEWLFLDEIQIIEGWERYVRQKLDEKYFVVITGSNASLLSRELGTKLTGRHIRQELFPFSYTEFLRFKGLTSSEESLLEYMRLGGFPEYLKSGDQEQLRQLFHDLIIRDIVVRNGIKDIKNLQLITQFLISNIGNRITANKLRQSFSISATSTVSKWFSHLQDAYLLDFVPCYKPSLRAQAINPHKVYAIDTGLVDAVSSNLQKDLGHKLENLVYLFLRTKYREIYYFDEGKECDFIAFDTHKKPVLVQVCLELTRDNMEREVLGLVEALRFFNADSGVIVTAGQRDIINEDGKTIYVTPAFDYFSEVG